MNWNTVGDQSPCRARHPVAGSAALSPEYHEIDTEVIEEGDKSFFKVVCSCGWTKYCSNAEAVQEAIYEHRAALIGPA